MAATLASSTVAAAQDTTTVASSSSPGWLGIQYMVVHKAIEGVGDATSQVEITITRVLEDQGAWAAGIRAGDVIERIFEEPASEGTLRVLTETLRAGDSVRVMVRRNGRPFEASVEATPRPRRELRARAVWELDSAASAVFRALDSIRVPSWTGAESRVRFEFDGERAIQIPRPGAAAGGDGFTVVIRGPKAGETSWSYTVDEGSVTQSFETYVLRSPDLDQLAGGLDAIRAELADLTTRQRERMSELGLPRPGSRLADDRELREIRTTVERLENRSRLLERQLALASMRRVQPLPDSVVQVRIGATRPITPYAFWSRDFFAGALIAPVQEDLGRYFGVSTGALIVQVAAGSPADEAGLQAGDVIVGIGEIEPPNLRALREAMANARPPIDVTVVRDKARMRLSIR